MDPQVHLIPVYMLPFFKLPTGKFSSIVNYYKNTISCLDLTPLDKAEETHGLGSTLVLGIRLVLLRYRDQAPTILVGGYHLFLAENLSLSLIRQKRTNGGGLTEPVTETGL